MNEIEPALRRAYALGQKYWQQADGDFARDHRKADETQAKFNQLVESMQGWLSPAEADNLRAQSLYYSLGFGMLGASAMLCLES